MPPGIAAPDPDIDRGSWRLRRWQVEDAPVLVQAWADEAVRRFNPVPPVPSLATAQSWIGSAAAREARRLSLDLVIESGERSSLAAICGEVGLSGFSDRHRGALIGYWLLPRARGTGLATVAVAALAAWAHDALALDVIVARCRPDNVASQRVASRAGFIHEGIDAAGHQLWRSRAGDPNRLAREFAC